MSPHVSPLAIHTRSKILFAFTGKAIIVTIEPMRIRTDGLKAPGRNLPAIEVWRSVWDASPCIVCVVAIWRCWRERWCNGWGRCRCWGECWGRGIVIGHIDQKGSNPLSIGDLIPIAGSIAADDGHYLPRKSLTHNRIRCRWSITNIGSPPDCTLWREGWCGA